MLSIVFVQQMVRLISWLVKPSEEGAYMQSWRNSIHLCDKMWLSNLLNLARGWPFSNKTYLQIYTQESTRIFTISNYCWKLYRKKCQRQFCEKMWYVHKYENPLVSIYMIMSTKSSLVKTKVSAPISQMLIFWYELATFFHIVHIVTGSTYEIVLIQVR